MNIVVIGNGIIGLSAAFRLTQRIGPGDRITIIGRSSREGSATLAAAAMLNSFAEIEAGALDNETDLYRFELSHKAGRMWPQYEKELIDAAGNSLPAGCSACSGCAGGGCFDCGTYVVNNTAADQLDDGNFDAIVKALQDFNEPHRLVSPDEIPNYRPDQRFRATRAVYIDDEGWFNPRIMLEKHENLLRRHPQVQFIDENVDRLEKVGDLISHVILSDGRSIGSDIFLLACGAAASDLVTRSNLGIPMQRIFYGVGVSIEIKSPDNPHSKCIRTPNRGLACGLYSVPYFYSPNQPCDHILIGASNFISPVPYPYGRLSSVEHLMKGAIQQINHGFDRADFIRANVGWRPTSQDTFPLIGKSSLHNLVIATGTKRDGFHMAPLISEYLADIILGKEIDPRFALFSPERKLIREMSREQAIEKTVKHFMSAAYQHGFEASHSKMPDQIRQMYKDDLERLHDKIGAVDWGIPTEMIDMYRYGHAKA